MAQTTMNTSDLTPRQHVLWKVFDFSQGRGLEIGPLHRTIAPRDLADVRYVDVHDRDGIVEHYAGDPKVDTDLIPEIDYSLHDGDEVRPLSVAAAPGAPYDWVVASHVIEHVPDLIGWLEQAAELVVPHGALVLAVPDRRYCFDAHRPPTTVGQMLQAHELGETRPSVRAVYDHFRSHVFVDTRKAWLGKPPGYEARSRSLDTVCNHLEHARRGEYVDCHVWTFTPDSFHEQLVELRALGLCSWSVEVIKPTPRNTLEFHVVLRRLPGDGPGAAKALAREPARTGDMPDWLQASVDAARSLEAGRDQLAQRDAEIARLRRQVRRQRKRLDERNATITRLKARVRRQDARLRATEQSWPERVAQAVSRRAAAVSSRLRPPG